MWTLVIVIREEPRQRIEPFIKASLRFNRMFLAAAVRVKLRLT